MLTTEIDSNPAIRRIQTDSIEFQDMNDLDVVVQAVGDAKIILLGEASHGTSEFYSIRAELTKRLIEEKKVQFIAVEGDWPSCYEVNRYIKDLEEESAGTLRDALASFNRWPSWMWANHDVESFLEWLREYNLQQNPEERIGFYGLDMYSLWESMQQIIGYLQRTNSPLLETAIHAFSCFEPYGEDPQSYGISAGLIGEGCEEEVIRLLHEVNQSKHNHLCSEADLDLKVNTLVAANAEHYYRTMVRGGPESWNIRDHHMVMALEQVMDFYGSNAKAVLWEHNTHIGDARATDMAEDGMVNVGQLVREQFGRHNVFSVGFGTHQGEVLAASSWGAPGQVMTVPPAVRGSWEDLLARAGDGKDLILLLKPERQEELLETVGHRAIGVVYHPHHELGNYVPSQIAERYDAFIYVHSTHALVPIALELQV